MVLAAALRRGPTLASMRSAHGIQRRAAGEGAMLRIWSQRDFFHLWAAIGASSAAAGGLAFSLRERKRGGISVSGGTQSVNRTAVSCSSPDDNGQRYLGILGLSLVAVGAAAWTFMMRGAKATSSPRDPHGLVLSEEQVRHVAREMRGCLAALKPKRRSAAPVADADSSAKQQPMSTAARNFTQLLEGCEGSIDEGIVIATMSQSDPVAKRVRSVFETVDVGGTGRVSFPEFATLTVLASALTPDSKAAAMPNFNQLVVQFFAELDAQCKERLGEDEFRAFLRIMRTLGCCAEGKAGEGLPSGCEDPRGWYERQAAREFQQMDIAGTGYVGLSEFAAWCRRSLNRGLLFRHYSNPLR